MTAQPSDWIQTGDDFWTAVQGRMILRAWQLPSRYWMFAVEIQGRHAFTKGGSFPTAEAAMDAADAVAEIVAGWRGGRG